MNSVEKIKAKKGYVNAVGYCRYSSDNQREFSIDAQMRAIEAYAKQNGIRILHWYVDKARSALYTENRPEFLAMINDAKQGDFDIVLVHKLDRFARNRQDSIGYRMELKRHGVSLVSVLEYFDEDSPESLILESVLEAMAEYYSKNLAREVRKGMTENALKGLHTGGLPPLGYDVDPASKQLIINDNEAGAVKIVFNMYLSGCGYSQIADELNKLEYRTKRGMDFSKGSILSILKNEKYTGVYIFNKLSPKDIDGKRNGNKYKEPEEIIRLEDAVPVIIPKEQFEQATKRIEARRRYWPSNKAKYVYLLSGKIRCGMCGGAMIGNSKHSGRNKYLHVSYRCSTRKQKHGCMNKDIRREYIEAHVLDCLSKYLFDNTLIPKLVAGFEDYLRERNRGAYAEKEQLEKSALSIQKEIDNLLILASKVSSSSLAEKLQTLEDRKASIEAQLAAIQLQFHAPSVTEADLEKRFAQARGLLAAGKLSATKKLIDMFIESVTVYQDHVDTRFLFHPDLTVPDNHDASPDDESEGDIRHSNGITEICDWGGPPPSPPP